MKFAKFANYRLIIIFLNLKKREVFKMEKYQVNKLYEKDENKKERQIGGGLTQLPVCAVNGQLDAISIKPSSVEDMTGEYWDGQFVSVKLADRIVWLDIEETKTLIELLELSLKASLENQDKAF